MEKQKCKCAVCGRKLIHRLDNNNKSNLNFNSMLVECENDNYLWGSYIVKKEVNDD